MPTPPSDAADRTAPAVGAAPSPADGLDGAGRAVAWMVAAGALGAAVARAWVADDAYITYRYVAQFLAGNGLVYNVGARVEGFTHPLWALYLVGAGAAGVPLPLASLLLSLACTAVVLVLALRADLRAGRVPVSLALGVLVCCEGFIDFATSGLEVGLTLLLVWLAFRPAPVLDHPVRVGLCLSGAYLCHPDVAVMAAGPLAMGAWEAWAARPRRLGAFLRLVGALAGPAVGYQAFRLAYYGDFFPNTYYAKHGGAYWSQGLRYALDFVTYAPFTLAGLGLLAAALLAPGGRLADPAYRRLVAGALGVTCHVLGVVRLGGDFMGFRLLLPDLAALAAVVGGLWGTAGAPWTRMAAQASLAAGCLAALLAPPAPRVRGHVVNERLVYAGAHPTVREAFSGVPQHPSARLGRKAAVLQECVGQPDLLVRYDYLGYFGWFAGTRVSVVDGIGLVDREVARAWDVRGALGRGQPGHEFKVSVDRLVERGFHVSPTPYEEYDHVMETPAGVLITLDPRIVCTFPAKPDRLRALKARVQESSDTWDRRVLAFIERIEARDRVTVETLCRDAAPRPNCFDRLRPGSAR